MNLNTITDQRGGGCPHCGQSSGYINTRTGGHWGTCDQHRVVWFIGNFLFSSWESETEEEFTKSDELLAQYAMVEPVWPIESAEHR